jgi:hypothetical protein
MEVKVLEDERDKKRLPVSEIASVEESQDTVWTHSVTLLPKVEEKIYKRCPKDSISSYSVPSVRIAVRSGEYEGGVSANEITCPRLAFSNDLTCDIYV